MNDAQLKSLVKKGKSCRVAVGNGLYFRITDQGTPFWIFRYSHGGQRKQMSMSQYGKPPLGMSLSDARERTFELKAMVKKGIDPLVEKNRAKLSKLKIVDELANDWLSQTSKHLKNPQIPQRVYSKDISPKIGKLPVEDVNPRDILDVVRQINESGRPTISNDALTYLKQLFNHAIKLGLVRYNPAIAFNVKDAGGIEKSRERVLSLEELETAFQVFKDNSDIFTRDNLLAVALLVVLATRKGELIAAKWGEFDFSNLIWKLPAERAKNGIGIDIPVPKSCLPWFSELFIRASGSEYIFPARRASKRRGYISDDTLNHALAKLFGRKVDSNKKPYANILGEAGVDYFIVHDLRRTCRSLLAANNVPSHVAERCLNHKLRGVEGIYDRYDYFKERKQALNLIADQIAPLVGSPSPEISKVIEALTL